MAELIVQREGDGAGIFTFGDRKLYSLENPDKQIPAGTYRVVLTPSGRAMQGSLWTPWPNHKLPLIDGVAGRTGIRIHAANERRQLEGCVAVGTDRTGDRLTLVHSRMALTLLKQSVKFPCWITILNPKEM